MLKGLSRKKIWLLVSLFFFIGLGLSKDCLSARILEVYLSNVLQKEGWSFKKTEVIKNRVSIQGLFKPGASVREADILCHLTFFPLVFEPEIVLLEPKLTLEEGVSSGNEASFIGLLAGNSFFNPKLQIEKGEIVSPSSDSLFTFQFDPSTEEHKIGSLYIEEKGEEKAFLVAELAKQDKALSVTCEILEGKVFFLLPWMSSFTQKWGVEKWDKVEGKINAYIQCSLHKDKGLDSVQANIELEGLNLESLSSDDKIQAKSLQGTLSFAVKEALPLWKQADLFLTFEELLWLTKSQNEEFGFLGALGEIRLQPGEDPYLKVSAALKAKGNLMPFELEGSYEALDKGAYWFQTNLAFFLPHSQPTIHVAFWQNEQGEGLLRTRWEQVGKEISDLYQEIGPFFQAPLYRLEKGEVEGSIVAKFEENCVKSVELSDFVAKNIAFTIPTKQCSFAAQTVSIKGAVTQEGIDSLQAEVKRGVLSLSEGKVEDIGAKVEVIEGEFSPSYIEGSYLGTKVAAQVLASSADALLHIECGVPGEDLQKLFSFGEKTSLTRKDPILVVLDVYPEETACKFLGTVRFPSLAKQPQDMEIEGRLDKILTRKVSDLFSSWNLSSAEGVFTLSQLSAKTLFPYFPTLFSELDLQGSCDVSGCFTQKKVEVDLSSVDISLGYDSYKCIGQLGNKEPITFVYHRDEKSLEGKILVDTLFIEDKISHLKAELHDTFFIAKDHYIWSDEWKADCEGIELLGSFTYDGEQAFLASKALNVDVKSLQPLLVKSFPQLADLPIEGVFSLAEKGCIASLQKKEGKWEATWSLSAHFSDVTCRLGEFGLFKEGQWQINTSSLGGFSLKNGKGRYELANFSSDLALQDFHWKGGEKADFKLTLQEAGKQAAFLTGSFIPENDGVTLRLNKGSHLLGLEVNLEPVILKKEGVPSILKGSFAYKWEQLPSYITLFKQMGFSLPDYTLPSMEGQAKLQIAYDTKMAKAHVHIDTPDFFYEKRLIGKLSCDLYHKEGLWSIDPCLVGPYSFAGNMRKKENKWVLEGLSFTSLEAKAIATGIYDPTLRQITLPSIFLSWSKGKEQAEFKTSFKGLLTSEGELEGEGVLEKLLLKQDLYMYAIKKGTRFTLSSSTGLFVEKSQWDMADYKEKQSLAKLFIENLSYLFLEQKLLISGASIKIGKESLCFFHDQAVYKDLVNIQTDKEITVLLEAEVTSDYKKMAGTIKNGSLDLLGMTLDVKNVQFLQEKDKVYLSCQSLWQNQPTYVQWQSKLGEVSAAALTIKEDSKDTGLSVQMERKGNKPWSIRSVEGSFQGLDLKMEKVEPVDKKSLSYNTQARVNFAKLSQLLPKKAKELIHKWGLSQGYGYTGVVTVDPSSFQLRSLKGNVAAEEFGFLGKTLHSLKAKVFFSQDNFSLQDLAVEDPSGCLTVKSVEAKLQPSSGYWLVSAPLVHMKDFSPSLFMKGKEEGAIIKNVSFYQVKGVLQDINSFEATGSLNFAKPMKKEFSFWDIPLNLIKDFGLDTGLLTPVIGEADFILSRGRLYFTALKNMFSEGERSQFSLASPSADSYLGLDGTWNLDLKMKQNVVLKVTEDLVLSVRGSIEKPKYSFKWQGSGF